MFKELGGIEFCAGVEKLGKEFQINPGTGNAKGYFFSFEGDDHLQEAMNDSRLPQRITGRPIGVPLPSFCLSGLGSQRDTHSHYQSLYTPSKSLFSSSIYCSYPE